MHTVSYAIAPARAESKARRPRRGVQRHFECEALEDRRVLSAAPSITFQFSFNFSQIANSIPSVIPYTSTFTATFSISNATNASAGEVVVGSSAIQAAATQCTATQNVGTTAVSITPINAEVFSGSAERDGEEPVVYLFFTPRVAVNLASSAAPATAQRATAVAIDQETMTSSANLFGQSLSNTVSGVNDPTLVPATSEPRESLIDLVEPLEPVIPAAGPRQPAIKAAPAPANDAAPNPAPPEKVQPNPMPDAKTALLPSLELDRALEMMTLPPEVGPTPQDQAIATAGDSTPKLVGAAAIVLGGYSLVYRQSDRFRDGRFRNGSRRQAMDASRFEPSVN